MKKAQCYGNGLWCMHCAKYREGVCNTCGWGGRINGAGKCIICLSYDVEHQGYDQCACEESQAMFSQEYHKRRARINRNAKGTGKGSWRDVASPLTPENLPSDAVLRTAGEAEAPPISVPTATEIMNMLSHLCKLSQTQSNSMEEHSVKLCALQSELYQMYTKPAMAMAYSQESLDEKLVVIQEKLAENTLQAQQCYRGLTDDMDKIRIENAKHLADAKNEMIMKVTEIKNEIETLFGEKKNADQMWQDQNWSNQDQQLEKICSLEETMVELHKQLRRVHTGLQLLRWEQVEAQSNSSSSSHINYDMARRQTRSLPSHSASDVDDGVLVEPLKVDDSQKTLHQADALIQHIGN